MADIQLEQHHWFIIRKKFRLTDGGVVCTETSPLSRQEFTIPYEAIPKNHFELTLSSKIAFWFLITILAVGTATSVVALFDRQTDMITTLFFLISAAPFGLVFLFSRRAFIGFQCVGRTVLFYDNSPDPTAVAAFIDRLETRRDEAVRAIIKKLRSDTPVDEIRTLTWLKSQGSISEEEYAALKASVIARSSLPRGTTRIHLN